MYSVTPDCISCILIIECRDSARQICNQLQICESGSVEFFAEQYLQDQEVVRLKEEFKSVEEFKASYAIWGHIFPPDYDILLAPFSKLVANLA